MGIGHSWHLLIDYYTSTSYLMRKITLIFLFALSSCKTVYLSGVGEVSAVYSDHVDVVFPCENVARPDCLSIGRFSKAQIPNAYVGQKIVLSPKN
jgi:hypothetical protein